jgi:HicB family
MTISLRLDTQLESKLAAAAKLEGVSKSEFVRRCLSQHLEAEPLDRGKLAWELGKDVFGRFRSERTDVAQNDEMILRELFDAKRRRR